MEGFACSRCGLCCRQMRNHPALSGLDRGDGTCRHFDEAALSCRIYEDRPLLCRVDAFYDRFLAQRMTREAYHALNLQVCEQLQRQAAAS